MLILTIRTDKPEAELGLFEDDKSVGYFKWEADRKLSQTILKHIKTLISQTKKNYEDIEAIIVYEGPGSFTGLRIGIALANALAYSLDKPIIGSSTDEWIKVGRTLLNRGEAAKLVFPKYGAPVHITTPTH